MKKKLCLRLFKSIGIVLLSIVLLAFLVIGGVNIFKHFYYNDYYSALTKVCRTAGLGQGFVPQGVTYFDNFTSEGGAFVSTGYMSDGSASRIYVVDEVSGEESYYKLISGGKDFTGHTGGLQYENGFFYLANDGTGTYRFSSDFMTNKESGSPVEIGNPVQLINHSSFVFTQPGYIYVGEFNNDKKYSCSNTITHDGKTNMAVVTKYNIDDLFIPGNVPEPVAVYSIPNEIQGFCITDKGSIVLSRSFSVADSNFFIYEPEDVIATGELYKGAPVYFLNEPGRDIIAPAMSEDLDVHNGKVITIFESACDKYFFGKLFFANYIAALDF